MDRSYTYDTVTYPSKVFPLMRPARIGALMELYGMPLDDLSRCRVLELGCGDGLTLLSVAHTMPDASFVGIDLSLPRIQEAQAYSQELGLSNIRFERADVLAVDPATLGEFDFIFAHGFLSWVPENVAEKAVSLYSACLKARGVGLISFNAYPGFHFRAIAREAMLYKTKGVEDPDERSEAALSFIRFLATASPPDTEYGRMLRIECGLIEAKEPNVVFHDELSHINRPFYFHEFHALLQRYGLDYVCEADLSTSAARGLTPEAKAVTEELRERPAEREQLIDLIKGTRFRSSVIRRAGSEICFDLTPAGLGQLHLASQVQPVRKDISTTDDSEVAFVMSNGTQFSTNHPPSKVIFAALGSAWPEWRSFKDLERELAGRFGNEATFSIDLDRVRRFLIEAIANDIVKVSRLLPEVTAEISERPQVSDFARWQANRGFGFVTNSAGASTRLENELLRAAIVAMDGTVAQADLPAAICDLLSFETAERDSMLAGVSGAIEGLLRAIRDAGLLVA